MELPNDPDRVEAVTPRRGIARLLYLVTGFLFVGLAGLGAILPILPTTPFLLLAAACFARSSRRFYDWLLSTRVFGPLIRDWRDHRIIPVKAKVWAVALIAIVGGISVVAVPLVPVKIGLAVCLLGIVVWLLHIPSVSVRPVEDPEAQDRVSR